MLLSFPGMPGTQGSSEVGTVTCRLTRIRILVTKESIVSMGSTLICFFSFLSPSVMPVALILCFKLPLQMVALVC